MSDDRLLGDRTADTLRKMRLDRLANRYSKITGRPCNCHKRREALNNLHERFIKSDHKNEKR